MKIATWNVERLDHPRKLIEIIDCCRQIDANILVLTETDSRIAPDYPYRVSTSPLCQLNDPMYRPTEHRVTIYSRYPVVATHPTYDPFTSICAELDTPQGHVLVYGTIMGVYGNRHWSFSLDITEQSKDIARLAQLNLPICICGDFNCSFADNYYYTKWGRMAIKQCLKQHQLTLLTGDRAECIDHIALSQAFINGSACAVQEWNVDKRLSDHKGIAVTINETNNIL